MFAVGPFDATVQEVFRGVFSTGPCQDVSYSEYISEDEEQQQQQ
jgi:hypothetical protein